MKASARNAYGVGNVCCHTLVKIADRSLPSSCEVSKYRTAGVSSRPHKSSSAVICNEKNKTVKAASTVSKKLHLYNGRASSPPTNDRISHCRVCLKKTHMVMQCPYVKALAELLQKRKEIFNGFDGTIRSYRSYCRRGHRTFWGGRDFNRRHFPREDALAFEAVNKRSHSAVVKGSELPWEKRRRGGVATLRFYQRPSSAEKNDRSAVYIKDLVGSRLVEFV